jgi:hypothetical protein
VAAQRAALEARTSFISLGFADGKAKEGMKLDVHGVSAEAVSALLGGGDAAQTADLPRVLSQHTLHSYVGIRLVPGEELRLKTYATEG